MNNTMIYVNGAYTTKFGELFAKSWEDLALEAAKGAIASAKIANIDEIDEIYVSTMLAGANDGQFHAGSVIAGALGLHIPSYRVEGACASGGLAVNLAYKSLKACKEGEEKTILVIGAEKMTDYDPKTVNRWLAGATGNSERASGISFAGLYGIMAGAYLQKYGQQSEILHYGPAIMHQNALNNPKAQYQKGITPEMVAKSSVVASPLRLLDCSPLTDGASAIILSNKKTKTSKIAIKGSEVATMPPEITKRSDKTSIKSTKLAWEKLKKATKVHEKDLDIAELHDCFSIGLMIALEDLGICEKGGAGAFLREMWETKTNKSGVVINISGGLKACGHPVGATGVKQIESLYQNLNIEQKLGLTHNIGGTGGTAVLHLCEFVDPNPKTP